MSLRVVAAALALALLHFVLHVGLGWGAGAPDLATLAVLLFARESGMAWGSVAGFVLGLLEDALRVTAFGASTLALAVVGAAGGRTRDLFVGDSRLFAVSYLVLGKWTRDLIQWLAVGEGVRQDFVQAMLVESVLASLYMAAVGLAVLMLLGVSWESGQGR